MLTVTDIALNRLVPSARNVRRTGQAHVEELAASLKAHGRLQNLTVVETCAKGKKAYEVIAGGRRLAALKLLAKRKQMAANAPIACHVVTEENVTELSLAENALQAPMHPADQFDAFHALHAEYGMSAEDIAARFGVTAAVVKQRLKLACVSPKLIEAYRRDEMNLDQLTAFTVTDDHVRQEKVWNERSFSKSRQALLSALLAAHVPASDPAARFVGEEAYVAAGGTILRDLFGEDGDCYFADAELLNKLGLAKMEAAAEAVRAEGWKWVTSGRNFDYNTAAQMRRVFPKTLPLSEADQARFDALDGQHDALLEQEECDERDAELERLEAEMDALHSVAVFAPADIAQCGAILALTGNGEVRIERGFLRREDDANQPRRKAGKPRQAVEGAAPLPAALVGELTAQQTMCLRDALGGNGEAALVALTHALAAETFYTYAHVSCLDLRAHSRFLDATAPGIADGPVGKRIAARHEAWAKRIPDDTTALWGFVAALSADDRLALLAHCVSLSVDAVRTREEETKPGAAELASAIGFDMRPDWQPTDANYFGRISRARILEAVREGVSPEAADNLAKLKKGALAELAEERLKDKGWLPPLLRPEAITAPTEAI